MALDASYDVNMPNVILKPCDQWIDPSSRQYRKEEVWSELCKIGDDYDSLTRDLLYFPWYSKIPGMPNYKNYSKVLKESKALDLRIRYLQAEFKSYSR